MSKETQKMNGPKSPRARGLLGAIVVCIALLSAAIGAAPASAAFGLNDFDVTFTNEDGTPATQAGSHPFAMTTSFELNSHLSGFFFAPDEEIKNLIVDSVAGFVGDATAVPRCSTLDFLRPRQVNGVKPACPDDTAVGIIGAYLFGPPPFAWSPGAVFNLEPPPGMAARLGFWITNVRVTVDIGLKEGGDYNIRAGLTNTPQAVVTFGGKLQIWGNPADPAHDTQRGNCFFGDEVIFLPGGVDFSSTSVGSCPVNSSPRPFLTLPGSCVGPVPTSYELDSWQHPGDFVSGSVLTHDDAEPPNPTGFSGCGKLAFKPTIQSKPSADSAETGSGLDFSVDFNDEGLKNPIGLAQSQAKKVQVTLPEGMTVNPSIGEGLGVCTPADFDRETLGSAPGAGCPNSSKIGTLDLETPLVEDSIEGSVFLAQQDDPGTTTPGAENPFDSLIALYLVLKNPNLGVNVKLPLKVEPDPTTGRLVTTLEDIPQLPFSHFEFHFREGQRAPLITPSHCGTYTTEAKFWPWSDPESPKTVTSSFEITEGVGGGSCPSGGIPPFKPGFEAGTMNNNAGSFSPFTMGLTRNDGEQDMTKFSSILPPGQVGSLAGVGKCPDAAVEAARSKTGRQEQASPSCPANSEIGRTVAGAGVGGALTYVPGKIYLGGAYKGAPLSVIAITPAVAGPFDAGTVAVRLGLDLNPKTAEVEVDGAASDPIPHILKGIVLKLRDLRVYVDRPDFTLNPTSCDESSTKATLFGSNLDVFNPADDTPVGLAARYQAANCLSLGLKPNLKLTLKGGTKRGGHPSLKALYRPRRGDANLKGLIVRLPRSAFLDQAHIRTICTRVQFAADACPKGARYGYIKAWTPLLDEPLEGPVWLRSSDNKLPDLVFDLHGLVDVEVSTRIDSVKGGIRATVEDAPDAPISKVELRMQGAKKGLIINSRDLCRAHSRAGAQFTGQNGKQFTARPLMRARCGSGGRAVK